MKVGISGKGGVGKTLLASLLAKAFAEAGYAVLAIDADPNANLAATLGFPHPEKITPISEMSQLIEERTGVRPGETAPYFKLNPKVSDLPEKYSQKLDAIRLMVMGRAKRGGTGCYCPENALLRALVTHLLLQRDEVIILDMEAGIEHLGRATAGAVDKLIVVVEPGRRSIETAYTIKKLAADIGLEKVVAVGNKIRSQADRNFLTGMMPDFKFLGFIPFKQAIVDADLKGKSVLNSSPELSRAVKEIFKTLLETRKAAEQAKKKI